MTRMDSVRTATGTATTRVRQAAETVAPYASGAGRSAARYARRAGARLGPPMSSAAARARDVARDQYGAHLRPRLTRARAALPPEVDRAATTATQRTRNAARKAAQYAGPRLEAAREVAGPAREQAASRSRAALAALRGEVTPDELAVLRGRRRRRARMVGMAKGVAVLGALAGAAWVAWWWWERQSNPDWLFEPSAPTEVFDPPSSQGGTAQESTPTGAGQPAVTAEPSTAAEPDEAH